MQTRSSTVLGKRSHQERSSSPVAANVNGKGDQLQTPDSTPNPKRARTTTGLLGDDSNKENIPPLKDALVNAEQTPRATRSLRRTTTESAIVTPTRNRAAPRRRASTQSLVPATPSSAADISHLSISTPPPTPPAALLPLHARVRALLRSTCNSSQTHIAGRDTERATITDFLTAFLSDTSMDEDGVLTSMFISGSPGTGKTALVNDIIRDLGNDARVVSINCMALKNVDALWERMVEELGDLPKRKMASNKKLKGKEAVIALLTALSTKCILILDELDHITPNTQALASLFSLPDKIPSLLRLIGIANTHTLTSSSNALIPSNNVQTIHFAPYNPAQLQEILQSRLNSLADNSLPESAAQMKKFLPAPTLMLLTKKVAALTGDVRSLFEVLRGAIDLSVSSSKEGESRQSDENPLNISSPSVTPPHILAALKAYTPASSTPRNATSASAPAAAPTTSNSETVVKIRNLGLQARLVLLTILLASKRLEAGLPLSISSSTSASPKKTSASPLKRSSSLPNPSTSSPGVGIDTGLLHSYYTTILSRTEMGLFESVSRSEFGDIVGVLEGVGLVMLSSSLLASASSAGSAKGRRAFGRSSSFGAGLGKNGAGTVGEIRLVEGVWGDEVLRGLGVSSTTGIDNSSADAREEEVRGIWERENARLKRDMKAAAIAAAAGSRPDVFAGAFED